jgi:hypothetical protein
MGTDDLPSATFAHGVTPLRTRWHVRAGGGPTLRLFEDDQIVEIALHLHGDLVGDVLHSHFNGFA